MLGSAEGRVYESGSSSGVGRTVLVPKRFVWPHGGSSVFLCGSFTRLIPKRDCRNFFAGEDPSREMVCIYTYVSDGRMPQCISSYLQPTTRILSDGDNIFSNYLQYKFNVDGEWRHDEQQPFVSGNYGVVNTTYLIREPDISPAFLSAERQGRSGMEVDNFGHMEANPRISESDLQVSRHCISIFLSTHTAYELLPESGKVIALDTSLPFMEAFHVLYEQGVPKAPLWDSCKIQFVGVLSAMDFILILKEGKEGSNLTPNQLDTHTIAAWKEGKLQQCGTDSSGRTYPQSFVHAGPDEFLKDVTMKILQNKVATVPIIHSSSENGSSPQLLHLASLSGILKIICRHFKHNSISLPILQLPISSIPLVTWMPKVGESDKQPLAMLKPNASLGAALSLFIQAKVSSIPIVDDNGSLLGIYSRSDIIALVQDKAYARINLDEFSIQQAMLLGQYANSPYGFHNSHRCHICLRSDTLHTVMEQLANPGVRRLMVVEASSRRLEGIISIGDMFRFLLGLLDILAFLG